MRIIRARLIQTNKLIIVDYYLNVIFQTDPECYDTFADLFYPVIADYHKVDVATLKSVHDLGNAADLEELSPEYADQIVSTRVRVGRTVKGFAMASKLNREVELNFLWLLIYTEIKNQFLNKATTCARGED